MSKSISKKHTEELNHLREAKEAHAQEAANLFEHNPLLHANENSAEEAELHDPNGDGHEDSKAEFNNGYIKQAEDLERIRRNTFRDMEIDGSTMLPLPAQELLNFQFRAMNQFMESWFQMMEQMSSFYTQPFRKNIA